ncbi:MAG: HepT-like ribonuclease domain-containing protein [Acidimicrobiales bacterium]
MSEHDDLLYLAHIDEAALRIERTAGQRGRPALESDEDLRDATIYRLQTLAESTQRLSTAWKERHPEIPWDRIAGFRNRLVHGYLDVDIETVWGVIQRDLPTLARGARDELAMRHEREVVEPERERGGGRGIDF